MILRPQALLFAFVTLGAISVTAQQGTLFRPTEPMHAARYGHRATLLSDGRVLVTGGGQNAGDTSAEVYDPTLNIWTSLMSTMSAARQFHTATALPNGKVLVAGGFDTSSPPGTAVATAELFDPATGVFTPLPSMTAARAGHTATLLPSGRVLIAAGFALSASVGSAEIFDPMLGTFESAGSMISRRHLHRATLLPNGLVLLTGGPTNTASAAEIFDETLGTFAPASAQPMVAARWDHTATLLDDGRVLIAGGNDPISSTSVSVSEIYDPVARQFTAIAGRRMQTLRKVHQATLLPNGTVLFTGGLAGYFRTETAEIFDPITESFRTLFPHTMNRMREGHTATLIANGEVLITGGLTSYYGAQQLAPGANSAEIYDPERVGSATPAQWMRLDRRPGGAMVLVGRSTPRRTVLIQTQAPNPAIWGVIGYGDTNDDGKFELALPPPYNPKRGLYRMALAE